MEKHNYVQGLTVPWRPLCCHQATSKPRRRTVRHVRELLLQELAPSTACRNEAAQPFHLADDEVLPSVGEQLKDVLGLPAFS